MAAYFSAHEKPDGLRAMGLLSDFQAILSEVRSEIEQRHKDALREEIETYGKTTDGFHARSALGFAQIPTGSAVEVEAIFEIKP